MSFIDQVNKRHQQKMDNWYYSSRWLLRPIFGLGGLAAMGVGFAATAGTFGLAAPATAGIIGAGAFVTSLAYASTENVSRRSALFEMAKQDEPDGYGESTRRLQSWYSRPLTYIPGTSARRHFHEYEKIYKFYKDDPTIKEGDLNKQLHDHVKNKYEINNVDKESSGNEEQRKGLTIRSNDDTSKVTSKSNKKPSSKCKPSWSSSLTDYAQGWSVTSGISKIFGGR